MSACAGKMKCAVALKSIASRYRLAMLPGYRTDWATAFLMEADPASDRQAPDWRASTSIERNLPMTHNTVFFMDNGALYSTSGTLDPTGNFYRP